jgi:hypothetical protein
LGKKITKGDEHLMAKQNTTPTQDDQKQENDPTSGYGKSGGNMGAGKSGKENLGTEKPSDDARMGSNESPDGDHDLRSVDDTDDARGGGSNQDRGKGKPEADATGGRRAKHNDDEDKYRGRSGGNSG